MSFRNSLRFLRARALVDWNRTSATAWRWRGGCAENQTSEVRRQKSDVRSQRSDVALSNPKPLISFPAKTQRARVNLVSLCLSGYRLTFGLNLVVGYFKRVVGFNQCGDKADDYSCRDANQSLDE